MSSLGYVQSLKKICFGYILYQLEIWCGRNEEEFHKMLENKSIAISALPRSLLDEMISCNDYIWSLEPHHIDLFIHKKLQRLSLFNGSNEVIERAIELIDNVQANITCLDISYSKVKLINLVNLMMSIPSIEVLDLKSTATSDGVLIIIGENCPKLTSLNVESCGQITDSGIIALCDECDDDDGGKFGGKCKLIRDLNMMETSITKAGATTAILKLRNLQYFQYGNTLDAIETVYRMLTYDNSQPEKRQLQLRTLSNNDSLKKNISSFAMTAVFQLCSHLCDITLIGMKNTDDWIPQLVQFPYLKKLDLKCFKESNVDFDRHISPLLTKRGKYLDFLALSNFKNVDLWHIGLYCKQLRYLHLFRNRCYLSKNVSEEISRRDIFSEVGDLIINCLPDEDVPSDQLEILLSNCVHVRSLQFCQCPPITDDLLCRVFQRNSLSKLELLAFADCNNLHKSTLLTVIQSTKSLRMMMCMNCAGIQIEDLRESKDFIKNENTHLQLAVGLHDL